MENREYAHRNWLLFITFSLVGLLSVVVILQSGLFKDNKESDNNKKMTDDNIIDASDGSFVTNNLDFTFKYLSVLERKTINKSKITTTNISYKDNTVSIVLEREALCTDNKELPSQAGFYKLDNGNLILKVVTNDNPSVYTQPCVVSNYFKITDIDLTKQTENGKDLTTYYKAEDGTLINLNTCYYNNHLYANDAVFSSSDNKVCECKNGVVVCDTNN
ncbi:hypothetical protein J6Z48_02300 [bacterium]|nr:hypothetical protein [bacterium]